MEARARWSDGFSPRLFDPASGDNRHGLSADMRLRELHESYYRPVCLLGASPRTLKEYDKSLDYWELYSDDPTLRQMDGDEILAARFVSRLMEHRQPEGSPLSAGTIIKHCVQLQAILSIAGHRVTTRRRQNGKPQKLILDPPYLPRPIADEPDDERDFTREEIEKMRAVVDRMTRPLVPGVTPSQWWDALLVFDYNVGVRIGTLMVIQYDWVEGDWLKVPPSGIKRRRANRFYLNEAAREAIEGIRTDRRLIFPWPNWPNSESSLHEHRRRLLKLAGITADRQFGFHGLRRAMCNELYAIDPKAVQMALGHKSFETSRRHYLRRNKVAPAIQKLPKLKIGSGERQRLLF